MVILMSAQVVIARSPDCYGSSSHLPSRST